MQNGEVKHIFPIMHPLYGLYKELEKTAATGSTTQTGEDAHARDIMRRTHTIAKNELHNLGLFIKKAKGTQGSILLFVPTADFSIQENYATPQTLRLLKHAQKELGEGRVIELDPLFGINADLHNPILVEEALRIHDAVENAHKRLAGLKFAPKVMIEAVGNYSSHCVETGAGRVEIILQKRGTRPTCIIHDSSKSLTQSMLMLRDAVKGGKKHTTSKWKLTASMLKNRNMEALPDLGRFNRWRRQTFGKRAAPTGAPPRPPL